MEKAYDLVVRGGTVAPAMGYVIVTAGGWLTGTALAEVSSA